eukprot:CAMPEP_0202904414 /NCGR_PEP_ID=MMETSP1392-20130828/29240_1 /ASSEMBLY_ACC=CAM_ASM_000868 /TAXON_ID=225041 /ORGANISM="Chlamydomonas chlamydogama, Strain SAG 11-48b" /LENGTH=398 /DNA_ID=CAMNT_0049592015 /DNA_START=321 /DNA_END=1517 /DNA_ORIENTATION=+
MVGSPGQPFTALVDTGSGLVHLACAGCQGTCRQMTQFEPRKSSSMGTASCTSGCRLTCGSLFPGQDCRFATDCPASNCTCNTQANSCSYGISYVDGSSAVGSVIQDVVTFPSSNGALANLTFGCTSRTARYLYNAAAPAILGLNYQAGSMFEQLKSQGFISSTLGFCLGDGNVEDLGSGLSPGLLVMGAAAPVNLPVELTTSLIDADAWPDVLYPPAMWVQMTELSISTSPNNTVPAGSGVAMLVDSGTSDLLLPPAVWSRFRPLLTRALRRLAVVSTIRYDTSYSSFVVTLRKPIKPLDLDGLLPTMHMRLGPPGSSILLPITASRYMNLGSTNHKLYFIRAQRSLVNRPNAGILGNAILTRIFVQADETLRLLKLSPVPSCASVRFNVSNPEQAGS